MKKRFVVVANPTTVDQDKVFQDWIKTQGLAWWHWLNETWLLVDSTGNLTAAEIREKAKECFPSIRLLVLEFAANYDRWAGFGPRSESDPKQNMFVWLKTNW